MIKLYNTLTKSKEEFKPIENGLVKFYQCGPTVYWTQHLGNLRAFVLSDLIRRTFLYLGYEVNFVRNYTDVGHLVSDSDKGESKIEKAAQREGLSPEEIAEKYIKIFEEDTTDLNILEPTHKPKATQYIKQIQEMVQVLLDKGFAYTADLAVYFDVSKANDYNRLTGQKMEEKKEGAGNAEVEDLQKKNPQDFALWFFKAGKHKNALQFWPSPFKSPLVENGEGFPGWHIECSVMIKSILGDTIDIHMGGVEHIPIHHTNEIAQSESANGVKFVNYWLHNEWLVASQGKISKSEGTAFTLGELKTRSFDPLAVRFLFLQAHYRAKQNFSWEAMEGAQNGYNNFINRISELGKNIGEISQEWKDKFIEKISDDFNIPQALALTQDLLKSELSNEDKLATILDFDKVFGLGLEKIEEEKIPQEVIELAEERKRAKAEKDFLKSDDLRGKIIEAGYIVEDITGGEYKIIKK